MRIAPGLVGLLLTLAVCQAAMADGIPAYYDEQGWHMMSEDWQYAVVSIKDGRETMLLRISVDDQAAPEDAQKLVWLTPVPAAPSKVRVDILRGFPKFYGIQPTRKLGADLRTLVSLMAATQIYPVPLVFTAFFGLGRSADGNHGIHIFQKIRRDGVELELIGAESLEALTAHLRSLEVEFPRAGLDKLKSYIGKDRCLVVFRIADFATYTKAVKHDGDPAYSLGVEVDFPAKTGFFPLVASSALPGHQLSVQLTVLGFVKASTPVPQGLETEYYLGEIEGGHEAYQALGVSEAKDIRYTRFRLSGPPKNLNHDLHFESGAPAGVLVATHFMAAGTIIRILLGVVIFVLLSILSVLLTAPLWPQEARPKFKAFVLLGLSNLATLIGLIFAARSLARKVGSSSKKATYFALVASLGFMLLLAGLTAISYRI